MLILIGKEYITAETGLVIGPAGLIMALVRYFG
jgi:hypothetical protein